MEKNKDLFEPAEYLTSKAPGFFATLTLRPPARPVQKLYETPYLADVVRGLNPDYDQYISQGVFKTGKSRAVVNLDSLGLFFIDLDTYRVPELDGLGPEAITDRLRRTCEDLGIPDPSIVLYSGRGLQVKWLLTHRITARDLPHWNYVQSCLVDTFSTYGADHNARDAARVLRLDQTINTKSGEYARVVHSQAPPCIYDVEVFTRCFPEPLKSTSKASEGIQEQHKATPGKTTAYDIVMASGASPYSRKEHWSRRLNWDRYCDLDRLAAMRGGVHEGMRELTLFWKLNFLMASDIVKANRFWDEARAVAAGIGEGFWKQSDLSSLYQRCKLMLEGHRVEFQGKQLPLYYTPTNQTIIDKFEITPDEEQWLKTIISTGEKVRRRREKRHAEGTKPQPYRNMKVKPWEALGISRRSYYYKYR